MARLTGLRIRTESACSSHQAGLNSMRCIPESFIFRRELRNQFDLGAAGPF